MKTLLLLTACLLLIAFVSITFVTTVYRDIHVGDVLLVDAKSYEIINKLSWYRIVIANVDGVKTIYIISLLFKQFEVL